MIPRALFQVLYAAYLDLTIMHVLSNQMETKYFKITVFVKEKKQACNIGPNLCD